MSTLSKSRDLGKANQTPLPRRLALALGMSVPAALALVPLASSPDYYEILVSGSQELLIRNCALVVLIPYVLVALAGLGNLVLLFITAVTGRVVETLYTPFNRDYGTVLIGPVDDAMEALKARNINAFYVENNDLAFWAQGQSPLFDANSLRANFMALHEDPNYILLGWRDGANGELTDEQIGRITDLRELSRQSSGVGSYYVGIRDLQAWREEN